MWGGGVLFHSTAHTHTHGPLGPLGRREGKMKLKESLPAESGPTIMRRTRRPRRPSGSEPQRGAASIQLLLADETHALQFYGLSC